LNLLKVCVLLSLLLLAACGATSTPAATSVITDELIAEPTAEPSATPVISEEPTAVSTAAPAPTALETVAPVGEPVEIPEAGLSLQPPAGWQRLEADWAWAAPEVEGQRVGLAWAELQPPAEPEAALLPTGAQILSSEPAAVSWGQARRVTVEVYGPAAEGEGQAPVAAVETHVLVVTTEGGLRRGYDFYASAPTAADLEALQPVLDAMGQSAAPLGQ